MNQGKTDIEIAINESYWSEKTSGVKDGNLAHTSNLASFVKLHNTHLDLKTGHVNCVCIQSDQVQVRN